MIKLNQSGREMPDARRLAKLFKVFSDEGRLKILLALLEGSLCVTHICEAVGMEQSAVSHDLAVLKKSNLVRAHRSEKKMIYSIADEHVRLILDMAAIHICEDGCTVDIGGRQ